MAKLVELAKTIRSKNASIYHITLDVIFDDDAKYKAVRDSGIITPDSIAALYGIDPSLVVGIIAFDPGRAIKINLRRQTPSGSPGEHDVFGSQFNDPLFDLEIPLSSREGLK